MRRSGLRGPAAPSTMRERIPRRGRGPRASVDCITTRRVSEVHRLGSGGISPKLSLPTTSRRSRSSLAPRPFGRGCSKRGPSSPETRSFCVANGYAAGRLVGSRSRSQILGSFRPSRTTSQKTLARALHGGAAVRGLRRTERLRPRFSSSPRDRTRALRPPSPILSKFALLVKVQAPRQRSASFCARSSSSPQLAPRNRWVIVIRPRATGVIRGVLVPAVAGNRGQEVSFLVLDFVDAFWFIPLHSRERRDFTARCARPVGLDFRSAALVRRHAHHQPRGAPLSVQRAGGGWSTSSGSWPPSRRWPRASTWRRGSRLFKFSS